MHSSTAVRVQPGPCQTATARRAPPSTSRRSRVVRVAAQKPADSAGRRDESAPNNLAVQFFGAIAAAQIAFSGAAIADVPRPISDVALDFPGAANDKDAVTRPKPGEAKGLPKGPTATPPSGPSLPKLPGSDAGKPDVAGAAKDALKKSPLGAINIGDVALSFPGQANDKDAVTAPKPGEAKGLPKGPTAKPPSGPSLPKLPGSDAGKPDVAGAAKDAIKKSPLGFMQVGDLALDFPGAANDKDAVTRPKPGEAKGLPKGPTATPPSGPSLPKLPGSDAGKPDVAGAAKEAVKKSPLGFMQVGDLALDFPGAANDKDAVTRPKPGEAKGLPKGPTATPPSGPSLPKLPGSDAGKPDVAGAAKDAVKKSPLGAMNVGDVALSFPGQANDKDAVTAPKPGEAKGLPKGPTAKPPSGPALPKLPGSDAGKPDVAGAAKDALKKSPLGAMNVGDVALSFPGQANDKDAVTAPKPGEAKGLPKGPTAKPPSGPSLPKLPGSDAGKPDVAGAAKDAVKKSPFGAMNVGDVALSFPGQANDKDAVTAPKPGEAKGLPKGPTAKPPSGPSLPKLPGSDAGKPDVAGAAKDAIKKSPPGFMQVGDLALDFPGAANDKDAVTRPKPGEAKGLPKGPTATPPSGPSLPKLPGSDAGKPDVAGAAKDAIKKSPLGAMNVGDVALSFPGQANDKDAVTAPKPGEAKGLPKGPTAKPPSGPSLPKLPGSDAGKPDVAGAAKDALKKSPLGFMHVGDVALELPGSNVKKTDLPEGVKPFGGVPSTPDLPSTGDLPNLPSPPNPAEESQNPLSSVSLPDFSGAADSASKAASKAQTAGSAVSGLTDAAGKAGDAKDSLQKAANEAGLE